MSNKGVRDGKVLKQAMANILACTLKQEMDKNALLFLLKLAWDCRYKLPLIITLGFMVLDLRMQLDVTIETRHIRRQRPVRHAHLGQNNYQRQDDTDNHSEGSSNSWSTIDEEYDDEDLDNYDGNIENT